MTNEKRQPGFFATIRWPLIVLGLLLGHATLMLVAVSLSIADPAAHAPQADPPAAAPSPASESPS